ncbi:MAG: hypothetical protein AB4058_06195 [Microcystaceae cyanobacterium]
MNYYRTYYLGFGVGATLLGLITFLILQLLNVPSGNLVDWLIGVGIFWWLLTIVIIPWNIYFEAKEVVVDAETSTKRRIRFDPSYLDYAQQVCRWSLTLAISLHLISAIALYSLAFFHITPLGYSTSIATLLLTGLRPFIRFYQYLANRLAQIRQAVKYPIDDVLTLKNKVETLVKRVTQLENKLHLGNHQSWASQQQKQWQETKREVNLLSSNLEAFQVQNKTEHEQIAQESRGMIARLTEDSHFLSQVREIIRFVKTA